MTRGSIDSKGHPLVDVQPILGDDSQVGLHSWGYWDIIKPCFNINYRVDLKPLQRVNCPLAIYHGVCWYLNSGIGLYKVPTEAVLLL